MRMRQGVAARDSEVSGSPASTRITQACAVLRSQALRKSLCSLPSAWPCARCPSPSSCALTVSMPSSEQEFTSGITGELGSQLFLRAGGLSAWVAVPLLVPVPVPHLSLCRCSSLCCRCGFPPCRGPLREAAGSSLPGRRSRQPTGPQLLCHSLTLRFSLPSLPPLSRQRGLVATASASDTAAASSAVASGDPAGA